MEILLVDDHPLIHEIMPAILTKALGEVVVHIASDLKEAFEHVDRCKNLGLVLLDLGLPSSTGIETLTRFRARCPGAKVVVISANEEYDVIHAAFRAGAVGYIPKTSKPDLIMKALQMVAAGGTYVPREALGEAQSGTTPSSRKDAGNLPGAERGLTERQTEVLRLLLEGMPNKQIAQRLEIAEDTVKQHVTAIYKALGVSTRAEALTIATRHGPKKG